MFSTYLNEKGNEMMHRQLWSFHVFLFPFRISLLHINSRWLKRKVQAKIWKKMSCVPCPLHYRRTTTPNHLLAAVLETSLLTLFSLSLSLCLCLSHSLTNHTHWKLSIPYLRNTQTLPDILSLSVSVSVCLSVCLSVSISNHTVTVRC
jgi:hypothetical protein